MEEKKNHMQAENRIREAEKQIKGSANREYKSRLFSFIFGREENRRWTLSLYNALHGTCYDDLSGITINTMEDVVYMGMKNDLSILVSENISLYKTMELYEQQSTYNPNMPVRGLMYMGKLYDKYLHSAKLNRYGRKLLPLPLPRLVTFYNGEDETEDETVLSLGDAFREEICRSILHRYRENGEEPEDEEVTAEAERIFREAGSDIEVRVRMLNINHGHNREMLAACRPLGEYAWFVERVRENLAAGKSGGPAGLDAAVDRAIDEMPEEFEIREFITANRAEVKDMCMTEYNEAEVMEMMKEEGRVEGIITIGRRHMFSEEVIIEDIMEETGCGYEEARRILETYDRQRETVPV